MKTLFLMLAAWIPVLKTECEACVEKRELAKKQAEEAKRRETKRRESARQDELRRDTPFRVAFANGSVFAKGGDRVRSCV